MQTIWLVRHGRTVWNEQHKIQGRLPGILLSDGGEQQVQRTAHFLQDAPVNRIISSPLERAIQTAERINQFHNVPIEPDEAWNEWRMDRWQGHAFADIERDYATEFAKWRANPAEHIDFDGELLSVVAERCFQGLLRHVSDNHNQNMVIVSHSDPLKALVAKLLGMQLRSVRNFRIDNAAVTTLLWDGQEFFVESLNVTT